MALVDLVRFEFQRAATVAKFRKIYRAMIEQKKSVVVNLAIMMMVPRSSRSGRAHFNARIRVAECMIVESMFAKLLVTNKMPTLPIARDHRISCPAALVARRN